MNEPPLEPSVMDIEWKAYQNNGSTDPFHQNDSSTANVTSHGQDDPINTVVVVFTSIVLGVMTLTTIIGKA